jgi:hypothetical protein
MFKLTTGRGLWLVATCGAVLCGGCDKSSEEQSADAFKLPKATTATALPLPPDMVAAVPANKGETPVSLHFALKSPPKSGQPLDVEIALMPRNPLDGLSATFEATEGMVVVSGASLAEQQNVQAQKPVNHRITLMPSGDGVFIVTATAHVQTPDGSTANTFSFPVIVGGLPPAAAGGAAPAAPKPASPPTNP